MSRRAGYLLAAAILIGSIGAAGLLVAQRPELSLRPSDARIPVALTEPVQAGVGPIPVRGFGTVRPREEIDVSAEVGGRVVWVAPAFVRGGRIGRGDVLFRLDDADHRHRIARAEAQIAEQQVELLRAEEEARIARSQYERFRSRSGAPPAEEAGPLAFWEPQIAAARAGVERARIALEEARLGLSRTEVRAPFTGLVRTESIGAGEFVEAGRAVGRIYASDVFEVVVPLADAEAALVPGLWAAGAGGAHRRIAAAITIDYGGLQFTWDGHVDRVDPTLDERTRAVDVIVHVAEPLAAGVYSSGGSGDPAADVTGSPPLQVGWLVEVRLAGASPAEHFTVRRAALRPGDEVWVVRDDNLRIVPVRVVQADDDVVHVTGGLRAGDAAVVDGIEVAVDGMAVQSAAVGNAIHLPSEN